MYLFVLNVVFGATKIQLSIVSLVQIKEAGTFFSNVVGTHVVMHLLMNAENIILTAS